MKNRRNYYRVLQVQPDAPLEIIKASYRTMMQKLKCHPDLGGDDWNAANINEAYAVLSQPDKRATYDAQLSASRMQVGQQARSDQTRPQSSANASKTASAETPPPASPTSRPAPKPAPSTPPKDSGDVIVCAFCRTTSGDCRYSGAIDACVCCGSPLRLVSQAASTERSARRVEHQDSLRVWHRWPAKPHPAALADLSPEGLRILSPVAYAVGATLKIEGNKLSAVANVTYCKQLSDGHFTAGVRFLSLRVYQPRGAFVSESV